MLKTLQMLAVVLMATIVSSADTGSALRGAIVSTAIAHDVSDDDRGQLPDMTPCDAGDCASSDPHCAFHCGLPATVFLLGEERAHETTWLALGKPCRSSRPPGLLRPPIPV
ncbi:hypothetical protein [Notoacmeibacter marinus]|uniref:hypothetical protein n=1 Tax=Notoacmeibacter marinus TaxID=1876515 RepID=UPI0013B06CC3|nr:hypothetical protein [Notoacmeibacter marinus]